jgi:hypothetical protein
LKDKTVKNRVLASLAHFGRERISYTEGEEFAFVHAGRLCLVFEVLEEPVRHGGWSWVKYVGAL